jgi:hypothetical protein
LSGDKGSHNSCIVDQMAPMPPAHDGERRSMWRWCPGGGCYGRTFHVGKRWNVVWEVGKGGFKRKV